MSGGGGVMVWVKVYVLECVMVCECVSNVVCNN